MASVTPTLEFYNGSTWADITADALAGTLRWNGGIRGAGPTDRVGMPGDMQVELDNSAANSGTKLGYYSPDHANIRTGFRIGAKIRVKMVSGGDTRYWLYRIKDIKPIPGSRGPRRVEVSAADYMEEFSKRKVSGLTIQTGKTGDALLTALVATLPFAPTATSYDTGAFVLPYAFANERDEETYCMTVCQKISQSDLSYIYVDGDSTGGETLRYEKHSTRLANNTASATLNDSMNGLELRHSIENIYNKIRVQTNPVEVDTTVSVLGSISEEFGLEPGESRTIYIPYREPGSARRMSGILSLDPIYGAAPITADTDYKMSSKVGDGGNDLNGNFTITPTAGANNLMAVVGNTAAVKGYVNLLQIRGYAVKMFEQVESISSDSTSATNYGERTITYNMPYQSASDIGKAFADELLRRYKDAKTHVSGVTFIANKSTTFMNYALTIGIGARITVAETVTGINTDYFVNGYEYELLEGNILQVTWNLEKNYSTGTSYWILGDATYGVLDSTTTLAII